MIKVNTYLIFDGTCKKAMEFYKKCLGGVLYLSTYGEAPGSDKNLPKEFKDRIIHARLTIKSEVLMASDRHPGAPPMKSGNNFFVSINCDKVDETEKIFKALSEKGKVDMPLQETFFAVRFGMLTDQFGIKWMLNLEKPKEN